jgi:apolipoprotein D and lipocalin family protein
VKRVARVLLLVLTGLGLAGCVRIPAGLEPVTGFEADRYLGTWYEIARLDHSFERGLEAVTATYARREDGAIAVLNRGRDAASGEWSEVEGRARFVDDAETGYLKVSFFGPFYGAYVVFELDESYEHALVSGPNRSFLWLLAREPDPDPAVVDALVARAAAAGFETEALIFVRH